MLSYLEQENAFLDQLEQKLDETENLQGSAEEMQKELDVSVKSTPCINKTDRLLTVIMTLTIK